MFKELDGGIKGTISRAVIYGNFRYKVICALFQKIGYSNHEIQDLEVRNRVYLYLKKHYSYFLQSLVYEKLDSGVEGNVVWICWLQGINNAPDIVKICYKSVKKWFPDREIIVIDHDNLLNYVNLPDHVITKWKKGIISNTLFSDFIRLSVLTQYGGIWLDATVYMTGNLPSYINKQTFFLYKSNDYDFTKIGESWFIKANSHNRILQVTLDLMNEYWRKENKIRDYFIMFIFMKMACEKYPDDIKDLTQISASIPLIMQKNLKHEFDRELYENICEISPIHKLTYKIDDNLNENTFYKFLINHLENNNYER